MEDLVSTRDFCVSHNIEISFLGSLEAFGLIEIIAMEQQSYIYVNDLQKLERLIRLHYDLDINMEGMESINHMLEQIDSLQQEIVRLRNRLRIYENA